MILGIGTDIEQVEKIKKSLQNPSFYNKVYTESEREYIEKKNNNSLFEHAAGIFCAKEACAKALGTGFRGIAPKNIEICHQANGKPYIRILSENNKYSKMSFKFIIIYNIINSTI